MYVQDTTSFGDTVMSRVCEATGMPPGKDKDTLVKYDSGPCRVKAPEAKNALTTLSLDTQTCTDRDAAPPSIAVFKATVVAMVLVGEPIGIG